MAEKITEFKYFNVLASDEFTSYIDSWNPNGRVLDLYRGKSNKNIKKIMLFHKDKITGMINRVSHNLEMEDINGKIFYKNKNIDMLNFLSSIPGIIKNDFDEYLKLIYYI